MSSSSGQSTNPPKAINNTAQSASLQLQASLPCLEGVPQRRGSAAVGRGTTPRALSSPRNNQSFKDQHKRHRQPRLADEDAVAESTAMKSTTSRKGQTSITHLMNFSLPPRPPQQQHHYYHTQFHRGARSNSTWGLRSGYHAIDKARYVHANYRFVVNPTNNYHAQAANADVHLNWDTVLQVLVSMDTQATNCPICLSTPVAPRMAKCGHIFCLPCLIRYMHSTDDSQPMPEKKPRWKKCPICWDNIYVSETRAVRWYAGQQAGVPVEGGDIVLRLVMRQPRSTLALPRDGAESLGPEEDIPWYHVAHVFDYARIMKGGEDYMTSQYDTEIQDLERQEREDELLFGDDTAWTRKAVAAVKDAKERIKGIGNPPSPPRQPIDRRPTRAPIKFEEPTEGVPDMYRLQHAMRSGPGSSCESLTPSGAGPSSSETVPDRSQLTSSQSDKLSRTISKSAVDSAHQAKRDSRNNKAIGRTKTAGSSRDAFASHAPDHPFYFYQALPHFYLSPLDIRILKAAFGDFSQFPPTILPRIEHISTGHMVDDDLRKRTKYLNHLPYGCQVSFLECDWTDLVSPKVLENFSVEIERRRKRNREKEAREEKERLRAEKSEEEKRWAAARRKRPGLSAVDPPFSDSDFQPLRVDEPPGSESVSVDISISSAPSLSSSQSHNLASFSNLASPPISPAGRRTVWGTIAVAPSSPQPVRQNHKSVPDDGWLQGWERDLLIEKRESISQAAAGEGTSTPPPGRGKKKNKKITLMSTTARRAT